MRGNGPTVPVRRVEAKYTLSPATTVDDPRLDSPQERGRDSGSALSLPMRLVRALCLLPAGGSSGSIMSEERGTHRFVGLFFEKCGRRR